MFFATIQIKYIRNFNNPFASGGCEYVYVEGIGYPRRKTMHLNVISPLQISEITHRQRVIYKNPHIGTPQ